MKIRVSQTKIEEFGAMAYRVALIGLAAIAGWWLIDVAKTLFPSAPLALSLGGVLFLAGAAIGVACVVISAWLETRETKGE